jgi:hypothetical protein
LPPPEQLSFVELVVNVALTAMLPSVVRKLKVLPEMVRMPGGFATELPPARDPPELVKAP